MYGSPRHSIIPDEKWLACKVFLPVMSGGCEELVLSAWALLVGLQCDDLVIGAQARQALARALKAWVENDTWAPELMPAILSAGKSPTGEPPLVTAQVLPSLAFLSMR